MLRESSTETNKIKQMAQQMRIGYEKNGAEIKLFKVLGFRKSKKMKN